MIRRPLLLAAVAALGVTGCSSAPKPRAATSAAPVAAPSSVPSPTPSPTPAGEPKTYDGVKAAVDRLDGADKAHDSGGDWDMLTASGQATMPRGDYIKVLQGCSKLFDSSPTLSIALNAGGTSATITSAASANQGGGTYTWQMVYENGHWKHQPSDEAMKWMGVGADKALVLLRNSDAC